MAVRTVTNRPYAGLWASKTAGRVSSEPGSAVKRVGRSRSGSSQATLRGNMYSLLAAVFGRPVTPDLIALLAAPRTSRVLRELGIDVDFGRLGGRMGLLSVEFGRLFVSSERTRLPRESYHLAAGAAGAGGAGAPDESVSAAILADYERFGLCLGALQLEEPDHLSAELAFMAHMCNLEAEVSPPTTEQEISASGFLRNAQRRFLNDHLGTWAPEYCRTVERETEVPFYKHFSGLAAAFIEVEVRTV